MKRKERNANSLQQGVFLPPYFIPLATIKRRNVDPFEKGCRSFFHNNHVALDLSKGTRENTLHSRKLHVSRLRQRHVIELWSQNISYFGPKIAPVHVCLLSTLLKPSTISERQGEDVLVSLLTNDCNIPLLGQTPTRY